MVDLAPRSTLTRRQPSPAAILAVVGFSVFVAGTDLTVVTTMLRPIIGDLGLVLPEGFNDAAWIVNAYLIAFIAVMPIAGRISDVIGRRRTFLGAYMLFMLGSILIPLSTHMDAAFGWFLVGRVLTALGGGAMVPVALAVIGDVYPEGKRARALGTLGTIETMGWVWGPFCGAIFVRLLSWQWLFWLNIPLAIIGVIAVRWALADHDQPRHGARVDWLGAILLTGTLVSLNMALLGSAQIQSVNGLQELTGHGTDLRWLYPVAAVCAGLFVFQQRHSADPLINRRLFRGRNVLLALFVNFVVGAGLVIAMVDVPLFVNSVELNLDHAAVISGLILSAMTAAMAVASYLGGRFTERTWFKPPVLLGLSMASGAFAWMGATWTSDTSYPVFALQLALLGAGFGLTVAPTANAVVDSAPPDQRGSAASVVMVVRLLGLSVGLSALTAWGLSRFNALRSTIKLPPLTDPKFESALLAAQEHLTAQAITETFTAAAVVVGAGLLATFAMRRLAANGEPTMDDTETTETDETFAADDDAALAPELVAVGATRDLPPPPMVVDAALVEQMAALQRRTNLMLGGLGVLLAGALVAIALLFARVADAQHDATAAQTQLATAQANLDRVEAGAALYSSQIEGFQQKLVELRPKISAGVQNAITGLQTFGNSTIQFPVKIDQTIPIDTQVVIDRTVKVPIKTTIPINQSFDTTIKVDTPLGKVPLKVTVPVNVNVPVDLTVDVPIKETVPIKDEIPVKMDVPVNIDVSQTQLKDLTDSISAGLQSLQDMLTGLT